MALDVLAVATTEVALARVPIITIIARHHRTALLAIRAATAQALVPATVPAAVAAPLAALAQAAVAVPLVVAPALVAVVALALVVVALADKRYVTPNLNPL